ncbi:hypothetical protein [Pleomorphovibrio marinus]|nr:hypothetical protein [Pleomorphovibrio marinus]
MKAFGAELYRQVAYVNFDSKEFEGICGKI